MPELPEIETIKLQLEKALSGLMLEKCIVLTPRSIQGEVDLLVRKKVVGIRRRAKVLLMDFEDEMTMAFHFKMTGQLVYDPDRKSETIKDRIVGGHPTEDFVGRLPSKHTRVIFEFNKGTMYFNDQRLFGWIKVGGKEEIEGLSFLEKLGPEPFDILAEEFIRRVGKKNKPIKTVIMDQEVISGVGNIYANDALWEARIDPRTKSNQLTSDQLKVLFEKIKQVLNEGIKYGGATAENYVNLHGVGGHYQDHFRTYSREGEACKRCGTSITKITLGGRGTFYCPKCQVSQLTMA